ncbi:hypothetical protein OOK13_45065 [Streptomyces sp. NBC_00378]|uniref:hypothetical protein n=1 Tax=Streptomyces sp. NBC_00378 TaxID=2975732 RepID=UPI00225C0BB8|nr:hypothetical protein [Streptomyces sp. NBC_00378]MCX5115470.1 hypothetical protein [Streptomyces sp. NBC_00378]
MSLVAVVSAHSCGSTVTSLALALAGDRPTLLAECGATVGSVRTGYRVGEWGGEVGLWHLAQADRQGQLPEAFEAHLRRLDRDGNRLWLPGLTDPLQAAALAQTWEPLGTLLQAMDQHAGYDVIADCGRIVLKPGGVHTSLFPAPLLWRADLVLLVVRNTITSVAQTSPVVRALKEALEQHGTGADALRLLLVKDPAGNLSSNEIGARLQVPVVAALPWDEKAARLFTHGSARTPKLSALSLVKQAREESRRIEVDARTRRDRLGMGLARMSSPMVAGLVQRLASHRGRVAFDG